MLSPCCLEDTEIPMIDHEILPAVRKLASAALRTLDANGKLDNGKLDKVGGRTSSKDTSAVRSARIAELSNASVVELFPFEMHSRNRRRDCVVLIDENEMLVLFAPWDSLATLCALVGVDQAAESIMGLDADKLLGLSRAFVRGHLDRGSRSFELSECFGSCRSWTEIGAAAVSLHRYRIEVMHDTDIDGVQRADLAMQADADARHG